MASISRMVGAREDRLTDDDLLLLLRGSWTLGSDPDDFSVLASSMDRLLMTNAYWLMAAAEKGVNAETMAERGLA